MKQLHYFILILAFGISTQGFGQEAVKPRPSPTAIVTMKYENSYVKITYCQPHKKDREIFGSLVPYGKVWRTGANEATEITVTQDITIGGNPLSAGTYSIFTIPDVEKWTIIINGGLGLWGDYNYSEELDVMRFEVPVSKTEKIWEAFTIAFEQKNNLADLVMLWDDTRVSIPLIFNE
ncbi:MAG: DUF2911 domain-containing protein [Cyclobacteriaceae bacterium]|nr:DUF2911 domain-containing protein [Cyclobacteriaceae bacterium]